MTDAAKPLDLPADVVQAVRRGERVRGMGDGVKLAIVPIADLQKLEALDAAEQLAAEDASETKGLDLFIAMAGSVKSGEHDVSADKYRHLAEAYASKS